MGLWLPLPRGRGDTDHTIFIALAFKSLPFEPVSARGSVIAIAYHTQDKDIDICIHVLVVHVLPPATVSSKLIKLYKSITLLKVIKRY